VILKSHFVRGGTLRFVHEEVLVDSGEFSQSLGFQQIHRQVLDGIRAIVWPEGSTNFIIPPGKHVNGVVPIKIPLIKYLVSRGWRTELPLELRGAVLNPGDLDAVVMVSGSYFAVEWETGNISSSHRAINKLVIGLMRGSLIGGMLILPSRLLYSHLTDRIGNFEELAPYFPLWKAVPINNGFLSVIAVEHDGLDSNVPHIPKGTDGRALR
jgi:hypothetical protein